VAARDARVEPYQMHTSHSPSGRNPLPPRQSESSRRRAKNKCPQSPYGIKSNSESQAFDIAKQSEMCQSCRVKPEDDGDTHASLS
jgi:hypothetical protein